MAGSKVRIDQMADEIIKGLTEYADLATDEMKSAVKKAGKTVKDEIKANAPKKTGQYASSWTAKTTLETAHSGLTLDDERLPGMFLTVWIRYWN